MIKNIEDNDVIEAFNRLIPILPNFFRDEVAFTISNTEYFLNVVNSQHIDLNTQIGDKLPEGCAAKVCMKNKKVTSVIVPKETFGVELEAIGVPIKDDKDNIIGSIVIGSKTFKSDILEIAEKLASSMAQMNRASDSISHKIENIVELSNSILAESDKTKKQAEQTDEILNMVDSIAKSTNLLGLNASIEAARAGEYGKGFNVVAKEIRKLSDSSKTSIKKINTILDYIKESINEISKKIKESNTALESQATEIEEITTTIGELSVMTKKLEYLSNKI